MKAILLLVFIAFINNSYGQSLLNSVRGLYSDAAVQEDSAKKMFRMLQRITETDDAVLLAYKGAVTMVQAKYTFNPITKFLCFKRGKNLVEKAISRDSADIEIRYLRFTLQSNLPGFLGYSSQLKTDKDFLVSRCPLITDAVLRGMVINFLLSSEYCNSEDVKKLQHAGGSSISR